MAKIARDRAEVEELREAVAELERRLEKAREMFAEQEDEIARLKSPQSKTRNR